MDPGIERRLIRLLRDAPAPSVPVRQLHVSLIAEAGPGIMSCARLVEELHGRDDVFFVIEPEHPLGDERGWPPGIRAEYEAELMAAGFDTGPHVTLARRAADLAAMADPEAGDANDPVRRLHHSLAEVWNASADQPLLRLAVATALVGCHALEDELAHLPAQSPDVRLPAARR